MLTEQTIISRLEILEDGQIQVRESRRVFDHDGVTVISETFHRFVVKPDEDLSQHPSKRLRDVSATVWTDDVKTAFAEAKARIPKPSEILQEKLPKA